MRNRTSLVAELISNPKTVSAISRELEAYGWQCDSHLAEICKLDVLAVLKQFENGALSAAELNVWANAVCGRADIGLEFGADGVVEESLFWLAKPELHGPINAELCQRIVALYERRSARR